MRRIALAILAAALLLPAIPAPAGALPPGGLFGGELRVALQAPADLDPLAFAQNRVVQELAYDSLTRLGPNMLPVPWLAASWSADVGAGTITMDLQPATWPDGAPITAQDVAWSFGLHGGFSVLAVDADTVRFTFATGGGDFLGNAATLPVAWKSGSSTPTANGPYVVAAQTASSVELVPNDRHWNGRPYLDRLTFRFPYTLAKNPGESTQGNDAACALMFGDVHLIAWPVTSIEMNTERDCVAGHGGFADGNRTLVDADRKNPHLTSADNPALRFLGLGMNTRRAPLTDPSFRQAISRAIDRDLIADSIEQGTDIADSPVSLFNTEWFNASVPQYRVPRVVVGAVAVPTLEGVNAYLNEIGYVDADGDGWRDDPTGAAFSLVLLTPDPQADPGFVKYVDMITKFNAIGVNVVPEPHTLADLRAIVAADAFDLFVDWFDVRGEPSFLFDRFQSTGIANVVDLASAQLDAVLARARDALDAPTRRQAVLDAQGWLAVNAPLAPIIHTRSLHVYDHANFEGWVDALGGVASFWTFAAIHVTQRGPLAVTVEPFQTSLRAGSATPVLVRVRDANEDPIPGVDVELSGAGLAATTGTTDALGMFETTFTAPPVAAPQEFAITADAAKAGYGGAGASGVVVVHPAIRPFLITISRGSARIPSGDSTFVRVTVLDATTASPLAGVAVALTVGPTGIGGSFAQASGVTDAQGMYETTFTATVSVLSRFLVSATVSAPDYEPSGAATSIEVSPAPTGGAPPTPALDTISMVAIVAALAALYGAWQRRKWTARRP